MLKTAIFGVLATLIVFAHHAAAQTRASAEKVRVVYSAIGTGPSCMPTTTFVDCP